MRILPLILLLASCTAQPATARTLSERLTALPIEAKIAPVVSAVDYGLTDSVMKRGGHESNPMIVLCIGKHPSTGKLVAHWALSNGLATAAISLVQDRDPHLAKVLARINLTARTSGFLFTATQRF